MEITQEHKNLILDVVRKNPRSRGNEDLLEDFCSETLRRSYAIISSSSNIESIQPYINKVATTAILEVLKTSGRIRRTAGSYKQVQEVPANFHNVYGMDDSGLIIHDIPDPAPHIEDVILKKEQVMAVKKIIEDADSRDPAKRYLDLFVLKYIKGIKQADISTELAISQGEVSKRLTELAKIVTESFV